MAMPMGKGSEMVVDLNIQYVLQGNCRFGTMTRASLEGCVIKGRTKAEIGDVLFLSFEKGIPLGGFKGKVIGHAFQKEGWTMGMYFMDLGKDEKAMLFERITYFSFLQERVRRRSEEVALEERRK